MLKEDGYMSERNKDDFEARGRKIADEIKNGDTKNVWNELHDPNLDHSQQLEVARAAFNENLKDAQKNSHLPQLVLEVNQVESNWGHKVQGEQWLHSVSIEKETPKPGENATIMEGLKNKVGRALGLIPEREAVKLGQETDEEFKKNVGEQTTRGKSFIPEIKLP